MDLQKFIKFCLDIYNRRDYGNDCKSLKRSYDYKEYNDRVVFKQKFFDFEFPKLIDQPLPLTVNHIIGHFPSTAGDIGWFFSESTKLKNHDGKVIEMVMNPMYGVIVLILHDFGDESQPERYEILQPMHCCT